MRSIVSLAKQQDRRGGKGDWSEEEHEEHEEAEGEAVDGGGDDGGGELGELDERKYEMFCALRKKRDFAALAAGVGDLVGKIDAKFRPDFLHSELTLRIWLDGECIAQAIRRSKVILFMIVGLLYQVLSSPGQTLNAVPSLLLLLSG